MHILLYNAKIWQWSRPSPSFVNWMLLDDTTIHSLGRDEPPSDIWEQSEKQIDLAEKLVLPGLQDTHLHVEFTGESAMYVALHSCSSIQEMQQQIQDYAARNPELEWIIGFGWNQQALARYPNRLDLDHISRPVVLWRACWHIAVANTQAMTLAKMDLTQREWSVDGGIVDVDENGPTGIVREAATRLVTKEIPPPPTDIRRRNILSTLNKCVQAGLTVVQTIEKDSWQIYQELDEEGLLPLRVLYTPFHEELHLHRERVPAAGTQLRLLSCRRMKLFADGSLGAETAALREPYVGTQNYGKLIETNEAMVEKIGEATRAGYQLEVHAIGDRAAEQVINAMEINGLSKLDRPIITHCQILGQDLLPRMTAIGIIGSIQPSFVITDTQRAKTRLPSSLKSYSYCWKKMIQAGITCIGGSDAPIETYNPFQGIYDAMYRRKPNSDEVLWEEEKLDFEEALRLYTLNAAYAANTETHSGALKAGYDADFVVVSHDVYADPTLLPLARPLQVWVDGSLRWTDAME